jgi:hypothetical protein
MLLFVRKRQIVWTMQTVKDRKMMKVRVRQRMVRNRQGEVRVKIRQTVSEKKDVRNI